MNNLNEIGKFDSLFKSAAIDYELPYNEAAWDLMQQKLDNQQTKKKRGGFWLWSMAFLFIGAVGYYWGLGKFGKNEIIKNNTAAIESAPNDTKQENKAILEHQAEQLITDKKTIDKKASDKETIINAETKGDDVVDNVKGNTKNNAAGKALKNKNIIVGLNNNHKNIENSSRDLSNARGNTANKAAFAKVNAFDINDKKILEKKHNNIQNQINKLFNTENNSSATRYYTPNIILMHNRYIANFKQLEKENVLIATKRESDAKKMEEEAKHPPHIFDPTISRNQPTNNWYAIASIANNIGYVSNPKLNQSSLQYHVGFGYNLSKNISIQTGIAFGTRNFSIRKDQFAYKGDPSLSKRIIGIDADISLIDIPITLRYQYSDKENTGWFSTIGLSTVFLKREDYRIAIDNGIGGIDYYNQNFANTPSRLSMLNLSFGYQYPVNKLFTLTVEPYLQLPFKVIGEGGSKISSAGLQISGKYNFQKRKSNLFN